MNGQLELNLGLLSAEQQQKVDRFLDDRKRSVTASLAYAQRKVEALEAQNKVLQKSKSQYEQLLKLQKQKAKLFFYSFLNNLSLEIYNQYEILRYFYL